jgi:hypothetical protein
MKEEKFLDANFVQIGDLDTPESEMTTTTITVASTSWDDELAPTVEDWLDSCRRSRPWYVQAARALGYYRVRRWLSDLLVLFRVAWAYPKLGYDFRDCWSLDYAMARWLAPRLRGLADTSHGCPAGYPHTRAELDAMIAADPNAWESMTHDFAGYEAALRTHAATFDEYIAHADSGGDYSDGWRERDAARDARVRAAFAWIGEWFGGLWN